MNGRKNWHNCVNTRNYLFAQRPMAGLSVFLFSFFFLPIDPAHRMLTTHLSRICHLCSRARTIESIYVMIAELLYLRCLEILLIVEMRLQLRLAPSHSNYSHCLIGLLCLNASAVYLSHPS